MYLPQVVKADGGADYILRSIEVDYSPRAEECLHFDFIALPTGATKTLDSDCVSGLLPYTKRKDFSETQDTLLRTLGSFLGEHRAVIGRDRIGYIAPSGFIQDFYQTPYMRHTAFNDNLADINVAFSSYNYLLPPEPFVYNKKDIEQHPLYPKLHLPVLDWHQLTILP